MLNVENFETLIVAIGNRLMLRRLVVLPVVFERNKQRRYYRLRSPRTRISSTVIQHRVLYNRVNILARS